MEIRAAIDPVTRLEGHLKIEITVDKVNGVQQVVDAWSVGTLFRGFEKVIIGRNPKDAPHITERICGVCPTPHGLAAVMTMDSAFGLSIPTNARILRNLVTGANFIDSHILHFYLLTLPDFVNGPSMLPWQPNWTRDVRFDTDRQNTLLTHYLDGFTMRRKAQEMGSLFGGRLPHPPAFIVGGFTCTPRTDRITSFKAYLNELIPFIQNTYIPDVELLAATYNDYFSIGKGPGNLLSFGVFDLDAAGSSKLFSRGRITNGSSSVQTVDVNAITESVTNSWYADSTNNLKPSLGDTIAQYPKTNAYSWLKAPRYSNTPYEVGPLARMAVNGNYNKGISVMDRHLARAYEALKVAQAMLGWVDQLSTSGSVCVTANIPSSATAYGLTEAPRGALGHWVNISSSVIARYQVITPTCWNASPRDTAGLRGPLEEALIGTPVENVDEPVEVLRVIHSFDPCLDCATHVMRPGENAKIIPVGAVSIK